MLTAVITLIGYVGKVTKRPVTTKDGRNTEVRIIRLGVWRDEVGKDGKRPTDWFTCELWGEAAGKLFDDSVGRLAAIEGVPRMDTFTATFRTEDGEFTAPVTALRVTVRDFRFLDRPKAAADEAPAKKPVAAKKAVKGAAKAPAKTKKPAPKAGQQPLPAAAGDDGIPF